MQQPPAFTEGTFGKCLGKVLAAAFTLPPVCAFQLTREFFTKELKKHYLRNNDTDVFSSTWNSVMITVSQAVPVPYCPRSAAINMVFSTLSSPRVSLLQPSCRVKHSTGVCGGGGREMRWQLVFLEVRVAVGPERRSQ